MKDDTYFFHQTPVDLAKDLLTTLQLKPEDILYEPFRGEGAFYNNFPEVNTKYYTEIEEGLDYAEFSESYDWVISNPPFRLEANGKPVNAFWHLLDYYTTRARKGIAFLANDACFCTLTPKRMKTLQDRGWAITEITVCSVKKWRGRYFFIVLQKKAGFVKYLSGNY